MYLCSTQDNLERLLNACSIPSLQHVERFKCPDPSKDVASGPLAF